MTDLHPESIKDLEHIKIKAQHRRIVFVSGNFNIIHPGHLRLLRFAKECGDFLVVGVLDSNTPGAMVPEELRLEGIRSISWVDHGFILHDSPENFIAELKPAIVVKGKEHEEMYNPEAEVLEQFGGKLIFGSGDITFSSVDLMRQEWRELNYSTIRKPLDFPNRHGFEIGSLINILDRIKELKVIVIGDTIVDEYITCDPIGMSQEDPTIVVTPIMQEKFIGGAAIVAAHASGLGAKVEYYSVIGRDGTTEFVADSLKNYGVVAHLYQDESRPTTLKQRYRARDKTLLRVSHLRQHAISSDLRENICRELVEKMADADLIIFSDFNYGCLPQPLVDMIVEVGARQKVMMVADSQSSSQVGDISRFRNMSLVTPTEREARLAVQDFDSGLVVLAESLRQKGNAGNVIVTLGAEGILIHAEADKKETFFTDRLPAMNVAPKDVAGAGDSFLTGASLAMAAGANIWQASYLGSLAAASQVGRIGNIPLSQGELRKEIANG